MMPYQVAPWVNQPLVLFHGTNVPSATSIRVDGIRLDAGRREHDFGQGFYTTTNEQQAWDWATQRARGTNSSPAVLYFEVDRNRLAELDILWFIRGDARDFWSLVIYCRRGGDAHARAGWYDLVVGPVSTGLSDGRIIDNSDQASFHSRKAVEILRLMS